MNDLRHRFVSASVSTAGPAALLSMLMDRLILDLDRADRALEAENRSAAATHLMHSQQIIDALRASLDLTVWDGATSLNSIYDYVFSLLVTANVRGDREKLHEAKNLLTPLRDAWTEAAASAEGSRAVASTPSPDSSASAGTAGSLLGVG